MATGTCDPATRGGTFNGVTLVKAAPNRSGVVTVDVRYTWDSTSVRPNCAGPVTRMVRTNTSNQTAWLIAPDKATGDKWLQIDPGMNLTTTNATQLTTLLGVRNFSVLRGLAIVFRQPGT